MLRGRFAALAPMSMTLSVTASQLPVGPSMRQRWVLFEDSTTLPDVLNRRTSPVPELMIWNAPAVVLVRLPPIVSAPPNVPVSDALTVPAQTPFQRNDIEPRLKLTLSVGRRLDATPLPTI